MKKRKKNLFTTFIYNFLGMAAACYFIFFGKDEIGSISIFSLIYSSIVTVIRHYLNSKEDLETTYFKHEDHERVMEELSDIGVSLRRTKGETNYYKIKSATWPLDRITMKRSPHNFYVIAPSKYSERLIRIQTGGHKL